MPESDRRNLHDIRYVLQTQFDQYVETHDHDNVAHGALMFRHEKDDHQHIDIRLTSLEKFSWMAIGAISLFSFMSASGLVVAVADYIFLRSGK